MATTTLSPSSPSEPELKGRSVPESAWIEVCGLRSTCIGPSTTTSSDGVRLMGRSEAGRDGIVYWGKKRREGALQGWLGVVNLGIVLGRMLT